MIAPVAIIRESPALDYGNPASASFGKTAAFNRDRGSLPDVFREVPVSQLREIYCHGKRISEYRFMSALPPGE